MGAGIIVIGVFLVVLGAKFIKATIFVVGALSSITLSVVVYFNIFANSTTTSVWVVLAVGLVIGLALGYFLIRATKAFFMLLGGYLGYTLGIFLYNLLLNKIHADPKVIYWVTIVASIAVCSLLSLWLVKHVLIFSTSICGGYAIIRGASLYLGHFPNENVIIDLIHHQEWEQLDRVKIFYHLYIYKVFI